jgi:dTDP-glucose pyrophosphorylase
VLNVVVPMAGRGSRFADAGYDLPKPLLLLGGHAMIEWVIRNLRPARDHRFVFVCRQEHLRRHQGFEALLRRQAPGCEILALDRVTEGAACTVLLARALIDGPEALMIANSDQYVDRGIDAYLEAMGAADGLIMTFEAQDPKWSYCALRDDGTVERVVEKQVISRAATVGIYNFARGSDFVAAADAMIARGERVNGEYYVAPVYNQLIAAGARIVTYDVGREGEGMHGLGTPEDYLAFQRSAACQRGLAGW